MTPIRKWKMIGDGVLSEHLKVCEFNQENDKIIRTEKFKVMENLGRYNFLKNTYEQLLKSMRIIFWFSLLIRI